MTIDRWDDETERGWTGLWERLEAWLTDEPADQCVLIQLGWAEDEVHASPYVQLSIEEGLVSTVAVSNQHLDARFRLDDARVGQLVALGWAEPPAEDSPHFCRDDELPEDAGVLAEAIVASLRDVYGVPAPPFLVVSGFTASGLLTEDDLPFGLTLAEPTVAAVDVTCVVAQDADELRDLAAAAVASVVGHEVEFDPDGDLPVPAGNTVIYVRVEEDSPSIALFALVLHEVRWTPRVGHTLNAVNASIRFGRLMFQDGQVLARYELFARPFVPELLRQAVLDMTGLVEGLEVELQARIGGRVLSDHSDGVA